MHRSLASTSNHTQQSTINGNQQSAWLMHPHQQKINLNLNKMEGKEEGKEIIINKKYKK